MELYQLCATIIFALSHFDFFAIWHLRWSQSAFTENSTEHENDKISLTTKLVLTKLWQNTQVSDIRPISASCWVMADTQFVSDNPLTFDCELDLGRGNLNFVRDTPSHLALSFCKVWLNSLSRFFYTPVWKTLICKITENEKKGK